MSHGTSGMFQATRSMFRITSARSVEHAAGSGYPIHVPWGHTGMLTWTLACALEHAQVSGTLGLSRAHARGPVGIPTPGAWERGQGRCGILRIEAAGSRFYSGDVSWMGTSETDLRDGKRRTSPCRLCAAHSAATFDSGKLPADRTFVFLKILRYSLPEVKPRPLRFMRETG